MYSNDPMDARFLIKVSKSNTKRLEHPHVKYNALGKISCIVCGVPIKSEITWRAHVLSKSHKENAAKGTDSLKRLHVQFQNAAPAVKAPKLESPALPLKSALKKPKKATVEPPPESGPVALPEKAKEEPEQNLGPLPEGFFDDARRDAEARNVPYKDKMDSEMEAFQKELGSLNQESEKILERDNEEMVDARNIIEIDKQIAMWEKIRKLEIQKDARLGKHAEKPRTSGHGVDNETNQVSVKKEDGEDATDDDDSDIDEDELNDFRSKGGGRFGI